MSRLDFAPKPKEIEITDFKNGLGVFTPKPNKPVSFAALKEALKKAGTGSDTHETINPSARKTVASGREMSFPIFAKIGFTESSLPETVSAISPAH